MQKIGIITMIGNNFGNRLQNYALQKYLTGMGMEVETIYNYVYEKSKKKVTLKKILRQIYYKIVKKKYRKIEKKRDDLFNQFNEKYVKFSNERVVNKEYNLSKLNDLYNKFIVGSDQVWNPYANRNKDIDFLSFSPKEKNITYAVSFGIEKLESQFEPIYAKGLKNFNYISVREDKGADIVRNLTNRSDIEVLIDPTMLLTKEEWTSIEKKPEQMKEKKKYILNYFLGKISNERQKEIERIAKQENCEIINILDKKDEFYACGPSEFLYLERNAYLICTDSFHSSVFAILYGVPFIIFNREDNLVNMNSRIETLLNKFKLKNRTFENKITKQNLECDYTKTDKLLEEERRKAFKFLNKALEK